MAAGLKLDGRPSRVYCVIGDGEIAEGQIWEAALAAAAHKLDNLVAILDRNRIQATGPIVERFDTNPLVEKWQAFGWLVQEIDGHDMQAILGVLDLVDEFEGRPKIIIAHTIKGSGVSFAENKAAFHNAGLSAEQFETASRELSAELVA